MPRSATRGALAVELALVVPLMIGILFVGVHFGRVFYYRHVLTETVRDVTRTAAVEQQLDDWIEAELTSRLDGRCSEPPGINVAREEIEDALAERIKVSVTCKPKRVGPEIFTGIGPSQVVVRASSIRRLPAEEVLP